ncbi:MAG: DUF4199 domain-containing protein [Cyclobacteriaceae bacterium]|nr:DUF4199 domain-containing protein [Cyclobacteriaceae bacterium]
MEDRITVSQAGLKYGLILGLVFIVYGMLIQFLNLDMQTTNYFNYVVYLFLIIAIVLGHKAYKEGGDGFMSIGQGLGIGMLITLVSAILSAIFSFIYLKFIDDSMLTKAMDFQIEQWEANGMSDEQIEQMSSMTAKFMTPAMAAGMSILVMLLAGFIISLIVSLFTKKSNPALEV